MGDRRASIRTRRPTLRQRLPTPGYDAFTDAPLRRRHLGGGGATASRSNSPYNADLPYDIRQTAVFGEASYDITPAPRPSPPAAAITTSREAREFNSGGLFSNGDNHIDETSSNGFSPRVILSYEAADNVRFNAQASKGFRLGGVNDPLNLPLCTGGADGIDAQTFGNRPTYEDETLWNYEVGRTRPAPRPQLRRGRLLHRHQQPAGHRRRRLLLVARRVQRARGAHRWASRPSSAVAGRRASTCRSPAACWRRSSIPTSRRRAGAIIAGIRDGNRLPTVPNFQVSANASYSFPVADGAEAFVGASFQHVGSRYTQPSDQENNPRTFVSRPAPFGGATGDRGDDRRPRSCPAYNYVNLSAGVDWDNGLGVDGLRHQPVRRERPAVVRPRARRPGAARLQRRPAADHRHDACASASATERASAGRMTGITRRSLLLSGAGAAAAARASRRRSAAPAGPRPSRTSLVVGAGVFGAWTALKLRASGQERRAGRRLGAGPCPRLLGRGIADDPRRLWRGRGLYAHGARTRSAEWRALSDRAGLPIFHETGVLFFFPRRRALSRRDHARPSPARPADRTAETAPRCAARFPQIDFTAVDVGLYEPRFGALMARRAVQTLVAEFVRAGGMYSAGRGRAAASRRWRRLPRGRHRATARRSPPTASSSPAGPGSAEAVPRSARPAHLPDPAGGVLLRAARRATRSFEPGRLPGWADFNGGDIYYGFPDLEGRGFKIAHDAHGRADGPGQRRPRCLRRRRWPTCAPSWRAASPVSPAGRSARRGSANMRTARTAIS